jgi:hypothetical protein
MITFHDYRISDLYLAAILNHEERADSRFSGEIFIEGKPYEIGLGEPSTWHSNNLLERSELSP